MAFLSVYDSTGEIECVLFHSDYDKISNKLKENDALLLKGKATIRKDSLSFQVSDIERIGD